MVWVDRPQALPVTAFCLELFPSASTEGLTVLNTSALSLHGLNQGLQFPTLVILYIFVVIKLLLF